MKCTWRRLAKQLWQTTISSSPVTKSNSQKPANAWRKIKRCCLPFTTSRLNIGHIYERLTPSNPPLLPSDYEPTDRFPISFAAHRLFTTGGNERPANGIYC